jgi:hypothetical protein
MSRSRRVLSSLVVAIKSEEGADCSFRARSSCIELNTDHHRISKFLELKRSQTPGSFNTRSCSFVWNADVSYVEEASVYVGSGLWVSRAEIVDAEGQGRS